SWRSVPPRAVPKENEWRNRFLPSSPKGRGAEDRRVKFALTAEKGGGIVPPRSFSGENRSAESTPAPCGLCGLRLKGLGRRGPTEGGWTMTVVGKILVFVNLVFGLLAGGLLMVDFIARSNYAAAEKQARDQNEVLRATLAA